MLGIGVDDMFVICNAIDQTSFELSPAERVKKGMKHAGASITLTSLTDAMAFFIGVISSVPATKGLCMCAGLGVVALYVAVLTIFLPFVVWDIYRVHQRRTDCCGAFCCKEDSRLFLKGRFLNPAQKKFSNLDTASKASATAIKS